MTVDGLPDTGFVYLNIHLDYGLEKMRGWQRSGDNALDTEFSPDETPEDVDIFEWMDHAFDSTVANSGDSITNDNEFKKVVGIGGLMYVDDGITESFGLENQHVIFTNAKGSIIGDAYTDQDGWYFGNRVAKGKTQDYTVWWDQENDGWDASDPSTTVQLGGKLKYADADFLFTSVTGYDAPTDYIVDSFVLV